MITFIKIWNILFVLSFLLLFFRTDKNDLQLALLDMLKWRDLTTFLFTLFLIYVYLPTTIPYSLRNIFTK